MATTRISDESIPSKKLEVGDKFYYQRKLKQKAKMETPLYEIIDIASDGWVSLAWEDKNGTRKALDNWLSIDEAQKFVRDGTITFPKKTKSGQVKMKRVGVVAPPKLPTNSGAINSYGVPIKMIGDSTVIKKGDVFYYFTDLEQPYYISDYYSKESLFKVTFWEKNNNPVRIEIEEWKLRELIKEEKVFLLTIDNGGEFYKESDKTGLIAYPPDSEGKVKIDIYKDGEFSRQGGQDSVGLFNMYLASNRFRPIDVDSVNAFRGSMTFKYNDILWSKEKPQQIVRVKSEPTDDKLFCMFFDSTIGGFDEIVLSVRNVTDYLKSGDWFKKTIEVGDVFQTQDGNFTQEVVDITNTEIKYLYFTHNNTTYSEVELEFIQNLQSMSMKYLTNNSLPQQPSASTTTTPFDYFKIKKYDLFEFAGDKKLLFVDEVDFTKEKVVLKSKDEEEPNSDKFTQAEFTLKYLQSLVDNKSLNYIGSIKIGDEFVSSSKGYSRLVTFIVVDYTIEDNDDIMFDVVDLKQAKVVSEDVLLKSVFINRLILDEYSLQRRGVDSGTQINTLPKELELSDLTRKDMFVNTNTNTLFVLYDIAKLPYAQNVDLTFSYNAKSVPHSKDTMTLTLSFVNQKIQLGELVYYGQLKVGDVFEGNILSRRWIVTEVDEQHITFNTISKIDSNDIRTDKYVKNAFFDSVVNFAMKLKREATPTTMPTNIVPKPTISDTEVDTLRKELSDLLFLKSGISDLDFEDKINISTEIFEVQRKIDVLTEKLFEQRVGDENFFDRLFDQSFTPLKDRYDMVIQKNEVAEIISPSGEMSDFEEDMQLLINSSEFKEWFGDWRNAYFYRNLPDFGGLNVSKVLNDKFEPQIVWHGTNNEFSYFDFEMFPANYFAVNREYSEFFATNRGGGRGYVLPFFLNIKNPLDLSDFGTDNVSTKDFFDWMYLNTGMIAEELGVNPMFLDPNMKPTPIWSYIRNNATMLKKIADGRVYDGIKFYEYNPNEVENPNKKVYETLAYIIFDPHQAKLADPSRGDILLASLKSFMLKRGGKI